MIIPPSTSTLGMFVAPDTYARAGASSTTTWTRSCCRARTGPSACCRVTRRCSRRSRPARFWYRKGVEKKYAFIAKGFAEIVPDRVSILAHVAERAEDIDLARAEAAKRRAEERIAKPSSEIDIERARVALLRALTRVQVSRHTRPRG